MISSDTLLAEAVALERLASVVSYAPDKQRLRRLAADLRQRAEDAPASGHGPDCDPVPPEPASFRRG